MRAPQALRDCKGWLVWKFVQVQGEAKPRKVPYYISGRIRSGVQGGADDREALASFDAAVVEMQRGAWSGIGFAMLPDWGIVALDFDNAVDGAGDLLPEVESLVVGTYAEWSPSGKGIHAFMLGAIADKKSKAEGGFGFETFCGTGFLTFTGNPIGVCEMFGAEDTLRDITPDVLQLFAARFPGVSTRMVGTSSSDALATLMPAIGLNDEQIREILAEHDANCDYLTWLNVGMALHHETEGGHRGLDLWSEWSSRGEKYPGLPALEAKWDSFGRNISRAPVTMRSVRKKAMLKQHAQDVVLDARNVMGVARRFVDCAWQGDDGPTLLRSCGLWYTHVGPNWQEIPDEEVRAATWTWLDKAKKDGKDGEIVSFCPSKGQVDSALDALKAVALAPGVQAPCWLGGHSGAEPKDLISLSNGMLHIDSRRLLPHTSAYFTLNSLPFGWDDACHAKHWTTFLDQAFEGDNESRDTLQELMGYLLTSDTSQQKMFLILGPKRSGKGTIGRVIGALVGRSNMVSPTLSSLTSNFGLQPLIDKLVALIPDARVGGQTNTQAIVERLLMISGEDDITVDRKNKIAWSGHMTSRVVMLTNELPKLGDASGALTSRFITLVMRKSFYGMEDHSLTEKLMGELPAIFRWALDGLDRLRNRGHFVQPKSAQEEVEEMADLNSPIGLFVKECCQLGISEKSSVDDLYAAWKAWCSSQGVLSVSMPKQLFGRALRSAHPSVTRVRPRCGGASVPHYYGIGLLADTFFASP